MLCVAITEFGARWELPPLEPLLFFLDQVSSQLGPEGPIQVLTTRGSLELYQDDGPEPWIQALGPLAEDLLGLSFPRLKKKGNVHADFEAARLFVSGPTFAWLDEVAGQLKAELRRTPRGDVFVHGSISAGEDEELGEAIVPVAAALLARFGRLNGEGSLATPCTFQIDGTSVDGTIQGPLDRESIEAGLRAALDELDGELEAMGLFAEAMRTSFRVAEADLRMRAPEPSGLEARLLILKPWLGED